MEQYEYAAGTRGVVGGAGTGRTGGAGRLTTRRSVVATPARGTDPLDAAALYPAAELLARRLADADPADAHDLFTAALGLYSARHFGAVLDPQHGDLPGTSWWHGPTAHSSTVLRLRPGRLRRGGRDAATGFAGTAGRHRKPERSRGAGEPQAVVERRTAARLLLAHPLVTATGPHGAGFPLIRRHAGWLTERFREVLGYPLTVGRGYARLRKAPLPDRSLPGFTPAAYAELVLALGALADGRSACPEEPEALRVLTDWQVLTDGAPDRELAVALIAEQPLPPAGAELTVRRLLAETPVVLLDELTPDGRAWLQAGQEAEAELFADFLGLETEIRAEGVALLDPADELTDLALPGTGTIAEAALLMAERLVEELRPVPEEAAPPAVLVPDALIDGALGDVIDDHGLLAGWGSEYLADRTAFRRDVLEMLRSMHLIAPAGRAWVLRAPAARYAPEAELHPTPGSGRHAVGR